ncbi:MAG: pyridoxal-phosphate dependent enzyme, partial [Acidimicrobiales bacterium]
MLDLDVIFTPPPRSALADRGVDTTRYREVLPVSDEEIRRGSIGVGRTPLVELTPGTFLKCDHQLPTGSFKDRGAEILLAFAAANGVREVVVDSSGNSASAAAAHATRRGMAASIYAPSGGPLPKLAQIERYG